MSLETPEKIRNLQRKLYCKAKAESAFRFYILCDKICREDVLRQAYALARANAGAPGVDGTTFDEIDASGVGAWLAGCCSLFSEARKGRKIRRICRATKVAESGAQDIEIAPAPIDIARSVG
jgi:RNA-directed DNA polymerase